MLSYLLRLSFNFAAWQLGLLPTQPGSRTLFSPPAPLFYHYVSEGRAEDNKKRGRSDESEVCRQAQHGQPDGGGSPSHRNLIRAHRPQQHIERRRRRGDKGSKGKKRKSRGGNSHFNRNIDA